MSIAEHLKEITITKKIWETSDTCSFEFDHPEFSGYQAGQFITIFQDIEGEQVARSYSFSSAPNSDDHQKVSVKRVENGKMSNYLLDNINEGDTLKVSPPAGHFFKKDRSATKGILLFGAGSGITPLMSILKYSLKANADIKIHLVDCNKKPEDIIFNNELATLTEQNENLSVSHYLSRTDKRLGEAEVKQEYTMALEAWGVPAENIDVYMCGPEVFMDMIENTLPHNKDNVFKESFASSSEADLESLNASSGGDKPQVFVEYVPDEYNQVETKKITAEVEGEWVTVDFAGEDNVLETLLNAGEAPPFSCMAGSCSACLCQLEEGQVLQSDIGILSEQEVAGGKFLSCQTVGVSENIKFRYIED